ncbi:MAG: 2-oxo acid dehydrogenase subunit E2 [Anaerolineae bacterium]|nr:2-oxo acid dehydrogenase subunit E2 [Anaerolineae bacterium]
MPVDIVMPNLGFDTQSGIILEWYKQPGDLVKKGEMIALIEADKANVELESIADGVMSAIVVPADVEVLVGTTIAQVDAELKQVSVSSVRVSPVAQKMIDEQAIDVGQLVGTGTHGRVMKQDVEHYLQQQTQTIMALPKVRQAARMRGLHLQEVGIFNRPITIADLDQHMRQSADHDQQTASEVSLPQDTNTKIEKSLSRNRQRIGQRLVQSKHEAPHFYVTGEFDLTDAIEKLPDFQVGINDLLQYLTVQALLKTPELNGHVQGDQVHLYHNIDLAIAVAVDSGLISPVLANADHYSLTGLAQHPKALIKRAREGKLLPQDTQVGTFTISNLGVFQQVEHFTAIINPPQIAILAIGSVKPRPVALNGGLHIRQTVHITLSGDHRVVDGMHLARFMGAFEDAIQQVARHG